MASARGDSTADNDATEGYRPISAAALTGLILGLASPLVLFSEALAVVPCAAATISLLALLRFIPRRPHLLGRKAALAGLFLAVLSGSAAVTDTYVRCWLLEREAQATGLAWFALLSENQPQKAYQYTRPPNERQALDDDRRLWAFYRSTPDWRRGLDHYVHDPVVRTLLALGPKARVRFRRIEHTTAIGDNDLYDLSYAVTFDDAGTRKTFFVILPMQRMRRDDGKSEWQIFRAQGGVHLDPA